MTKKDNIIGAEKLEEKGKAGMEFGKYTCRCTYRFKGLTNPTKNDASKLIKEENKNVEKG